VTSILKTIATGISETSEASAHIMWWYIPEDCFACRWPWETHILQLFKNIKYFLDDHQLPINLGPLFTKQLSFCGKHLFICMLSPENCHLLQNFTQAHETRCKWPVVCQKGAFQREIKFLYKPTSQLLPDYTALQPRRQPSSRHKCSSVFHT
jgi:hypothetical protein